MARKIPAADIDNAVSAYLAGESAEVVAPRHGFSAPVLVRHLKERGLFRTTAERYALSGQKIAATVVAGTGLDADDVVRRYLAGESSNAIAKSLCRSRSAIDRRLTDAGVTLRTVEEGNRLRASQRSPEENREIMRAAQAAQRGKPRAFDALCRAAVARQNSVAWNTGDAHVSADERTMAEWLRAAGLDVVQQRAVGPYNVDVTTGSVAVEIHGGGWHNYGSHKARAVERARYILDQGWTLVVVWLRSGNGAVTLTRASGDYVVALADVAGRDPSLRGQYRVIWGDGQVAPVLGADLNELSDKPPRR